MRETGGAAKANRVRLDTGASNDKSVTEQVDTTRAKQSPSVAQSSYAAKMNIYKQGIQNVGNSVFVLDMDKQIQSFCLATGGNFGSLFGSKGCFAVGVTQEELVFDIRSGSRQMGIFVPKGFCEGRELRETPMPSKDTLFQDFVSAPDAKACAPSAFGRICWDPKAEPANYIRVPPNLLLDRQDRTGNRRAAMEGWALPSMLAFFAERVWCLKAPKLLISMIGSSTDFEMNVLHRNQVLSEVMTVAKETEAWITTIGLDSGIGKHVGEAKRATGIKVPLIGIAPWGMIEGRQALWEK